METTYFAIDCHGDELKETFIVPENMEVIMACKSGFCLYIDDEIDFVYNLYIQPEFYESEENFYSELSKSQTLRNYFCVLKSGTAIPDIELTPDYYDEKETFFSHFRAGIAELPYRGLVYEFPKENKFHSKKLSRLFIEKMRKKDKTKLQLEMVLPNIETSKYIPEIIKKYNPKHTKINPVEFVKKIRKPETQVVLFSKYHLILEPLLLSNVLRGLREDYDSSIKIIVLCMFCRFTENAMSKRHNFKSTIGKTK